MLKYFCNKLIYATLTLCATFYVAGCAQTSRKHLDDMGYRNASYSVALKWVGDDGLSIAFKRAINNTIKSNSLFKLSYYGSAEIIINNVTNVVPIYSEDNAIIGFTYHVIVYRRASSNSSLANSVGVNGKCKNDDLHSCASHILDVIQKKL